MSLSAKYEKKLLASTLFMGCDSKSYYSFIQSLTPVSVVKGQSFSSYGTGLSLMLLLDGRLDIYMPTGVLFVTLKPGDFFEPLSMFSHIKPLLPFRIRARTNALIVPLDKNILLPIFETDPVVARNYMEILSDNLQNALSRLCHFTAVTPSVALALYLLRSDNNILKTPDGFAGLARRLNISRATFYRALSELEHLNLVSHHEKTVLILDRKGLLAFVCTHSEMSANISPTS